MKTLLTFCLSVAIAGVAFAQAPLVPRPETAKPARTVVDAKKHDAERIYVKFRDDVPVRLRAGKLAAVGAKSNALSPASGLLNRLAAAGVKWERQHSVSEEKLNEMRETAQRKSGKAMADLNNAYILRVPKGVKADQFIDELNALDSVEIAKPMALPSPDPVAGNYQAEQGYLNAAPGGIDADYAWTQLAGAGGNVWIADIESNWNLAHTDLNSPTLIGPASALTAQTNIDHGTAVLGILSGRNNGVGVTGIAYNSTIFVAARITAAGYDPAAAITRCMAALREGDILVLEMQTDGPANSVDSMGAAVDLVPIEWEEPSYNVIKMAVGMGIIVVEAAGNGSQNLDDPIFNTGHAPFRPENDSGAIIVGAGGTAAGGAGDRSRLDFSTFGSTVDLQGWGEGVVTTGYGDRYPGGMPPSPALMNEWYTATFNGTSSATPTVAGACAALQAHYKISNFGTVLTPFEVREILRSTGSQQLDGAAINPGGTYSQTGMTVTRRSGSRKFATSDINSIIVFSTGQQAIIIGRVSDTEATVSNSQTVAETAITLNRPVYQNIGPRPNLRAALPLVSAPTKWVDFTYNGAEFGTFPQPYNTLPEGVNNVTVGGNVTFKGGTNSWTGTITKQLTLKTYGSPVTLGQ
jgi:serine protease